MRNTQYSYNAMVTTYCYFPQQNVIVMVCLFLDFFNSPKANKQEKKSTQQVCVQCCAVFWSCWKMKQRQSLIPSIPLPPTVSVQGVL